MTYIKIEEEFKEKKCPNCGSSNIKYIKASFNCKSCNKKYIHFENINIFTGEI